MRPVTMTQYVLGTECIVLGEARPNDKRLLKVKRAPRRGLTLSVGTTYSVYAMKLAAGILCCPIAKVQYS